MVNYSDSHQIGCTHRQTKTFKFNYLAYAREDEKKKERIEIEKNQSVNCQCGRSFCVLFFFSSSVSLFEYSKQRRIMEACTFFSVC